jgi:hypothetical protein
MKCGTQRRANRRCAALSRSVQRPKGARLSAGLAMIERRICNAFFRGEPFEGRSQHIEILVAIKTQVFSLRGLDQNGGQLARLAL